MPRCSISLSPKNSPSNCSMPGMKWPNLHLQNSSLNLHFFAKLLSFIHVLKYHLETVHWADLAFHHSNVSIISSEFSRGPGCESENRSAYVPKMPHIGLSWCIGIRVVERIHVPAWLWKAVKPWLLLLFFLKCSLHLKSDALDPKMDPTILDTSPIFFQISHDFSSFQKSWPCPCQAALRRQFGRGVQSVTQRAPEVAWQLRLNVSCASCFRPNIDQFMRWYEYHPVIWRFLKSYGGYSPPKKNVYYIIEHVFYMTPRKSSPQINCSAGNQRWLAEISSEWILPDARFDYQMVYSIHIPSKPPFYPTHILWNPKNIPLNHYKSL